MPEEISLDDELVTLLRREPFIAFKISLSNGERFEIDSPGSVAIGGSLITIANRMSGQTYFRKNQIVSIEAPD